VHAAGRVLAASDLEVTYVETSRNDFNGQPPELT
jgi:hypothetical protein